jgi:hypothetical protein
MSADLDLSGFDPTRLSRLWSSAVSTAPAWEPAELAEALQLQLGLRVGRPPAADDFDGTYRQLLVDPHPPMAALRRVKDWAKPMMSRDDGELPREVAGVLYFAAVAADRLRGSGSVSELPDERVRRGATWALRLPWLAEPMLTELFRAAAGIGTDSTSDDPAG